MRFVAAGIAFLGTAHAQTCTGQGSAQGLDGVTLDFLTASIQVNNLGGYGPDQFFSLEDKRYIRYGGIGFDYVEETPFDLVIINTSYYKPNKSGRNGYTFAGDFGMVNLADDESCDFKYEFRVENEENEYVVDRRFEFCLFDFDTGDGLEGSGQARLIEGLEICQDDMLYTTAWEDTNGMLNSSIAVTNLGDNCWRFLATQLGVGADNPERPDQVLRPYSAMTEFVKTDVAPKYVCIDFPKGLNGFEVTYSITPSAEPGFSGRNFLFSGNTANTLEVFYVPCYHCADPIIPDLDPAQPAYGRPESVEIPGYCIACGGTASQHPCYKDQDPPRINSWDLEELEFFPPNYEFAPTNGEFPPNCPKDVAQYCSEDNPDPSGDVTYPVCMGPPLNCALACNEIDAPTCFPPPSPPPPSPPPSPPPPSPPPPVGYACWNHICYNCADAPCAGNAECESLCETNQFSDEDTCKKIGLGGDGCDPIVCVVETTKCTACSELSSQDPVAGTGLPEICTLYKIHNEPGECKCPDYCLSTEYAGLRPVEPCPTFLPSCSGCDQPLCAGCGPGGEGGQHCNTPECKDCDAAECAPCDTSVCTFKKEMTCYEDTPCGSVPPPPPPPPKCLPSCDSSCYNCGGADQPPCPPNCGPECVSCEGSLPCSDSDDDDGDCDDDDDDKKGVKTDYTAAEVAAQTAEVAEAAAQQAVVMAQAAEAAEAEAAKKAVVAVQVFAKAAEARAAADASALEAEAHQDKDAIARAEAHARAAAAAMAAAQTAARAEAEAAAEAKAAATQAATAQQLFADAQQKATVAAAAAAAEAGIDAPQLTITKTSTTAAPAASATAQTAMGERTMVLLSVVFLAGILGLAVIHAVLRANKRDHAKVPSVATMDP